MHSCTFELGVGFDRLYQILSHGAISKVAYTILFLNSC